VHAVDFPIGIIEMPSGDRRTLLRAATLLAATAMPRSACAVRVASRSTGWDWIWLLGGSGQTAVDCYLSVFLGWPEGDIDRPPDAVHLPRATCDLLAANGWHDANQASWTASRWCSDPAAAARLVVNTLELVLHAAMDDLLWEGFMS
jgi:hypothetical protein